MRSRARPCASAACVVARSAPADATKFGAAARGAPTQWRSCARVNVFETHDVVLAEIIAALHLDDLDGLLGEILQAMLRAERDEDRFVYMQIQHLLAAGHTRGPAHHHPVLCAAMVHLQRQAGARRDADALDLEIRTLLQRVVPAPRPLHLAVRDHFRAALL